MLSISSLPSYILDLYCHIIRMRSCDDSLVHLSFRSLANADLVVSVVLWFHIVVYVLKEDHSKKE